MTSESDATGASAGQGKKTLGFFSMVMMLACGLLNTDLISSNTAAGLPIVSWWIIIGLLYMIPSGLVMTELTLAYPKNGGIYYWIKDGLGPKWATRVSWLYWACGVFMPPASYLMAADLICSTFFPGVSYVGRTVIAVIMLWLGMFIATKPLEESKIAFDAMGIINIGVYVFVFIAGIVYVMQGNAPANEMSLQAMMPRLDQAVIYVPIALFCASGMEIVSQSVESSINPARDMLRSMIVITVLCAGLNCLASIGILLIEPLDKMSIMSGIADIFVTAWANRFLYCLINVLIVVGILSQVTSWTLAAARGIAESAKEGEFPKVFARETKAGIPYAAMMINGIIASTFLITYAFVAETASDAFYALMGCSTIASMIPYILLVISYNRLRKGKLKDYQGWKVPCGRAVSYVLQYMQVFVTVLLIWVPGQGITASAPIIIIGMVVILALGEVIIRYQAHKRKSLPFTAENDS